MKYQGFMGGSASLRSVNANAERTVNLYPESTSPGVAKAPMILLKTPGLKPYVTLAGGPVRQLFGQDGRVFAVSGPYFYEIFPNRSFQFWGHVGGGTRPATIHSNGAGGSQLFIVSGGFGYIFDMKGNTLTQITDDAFPPVCSMGEYVDGYFIALVAHSSQFQISALFDGLDWNGLDVAQVSQVSDEVRAILINHRELWMFGSKHTTPWFDSGNPSFPFQPIQGTVIHQGVAAPASTARFDNAIIWVGANEHGARVVWRAQGVAPQRISTHAVEMALNSVPTIEDAIAYTYQEEGHEFYMLYVPDLETTWAYDAATQLWHERGVWIPEHGHYEPHPSRCHCYAFDQRHLVGDRKTGTVYEMSLAIWHDTLVNAA